MPRRKTDSGGASSNSASHFIENIPTLPPEAEPDDLIPEGSTEDNHTPYKAADDPAPVSYDTKAQGAALSPESEIPPRATTAGAAANSNSYRAPGPNPQPTAHTAPPPAQPSAPAPPQAAAQSGGSWGGLVLKAAVGGLVMGLVGGIFDDDIF